MVTDNIALVVRESGSVKRRNVNHKHKKQHGSSTCGLCKPSKKVGQPRKDKHYLVDQIYKKEVNK